MSKRTVLLIADDHKTERSVKDSLGREHHLETVRNGKAANGFLAKKSADLIIIDFDLKGEDGLQVYKKLSPQAKVIMLSASGSVPLAVSATKLGVTEFLRKPIEVEQLRKCVEKNIVEHYQKLVWIEGLEWLRGETPGLKEMFSSIQGALKENEDIVLVGEVGIPKQKVAEFIHANGPKRGRRFVSIDVSSFRQEQLESHFWATIQELVMLPVVSSVQNVAERCGTIYLEGIEKLDDLFLATIAKFFKERKGKIDKGIRLIIGINKGDFPRFKERDYSWIKIPRLRERKGDLPYLLDHYLKYYSNKYSKEIKYVFADVLAFLAAYDYPGNYLELERIIEEAVLLAKADKLALENFPINLAKIIGDVLKKGVMENLSLAEAKKYFEKSLFSVLLEKNNQDVAALARFLDCPKTVLADRAEDLLN